MFVSPLASAIKNPSVKIHHGEMGDFWLAKDRTHVRVSLSENPQSRGMTTRQAAAFWGVHYHTFRKLVRLGVIPGPLKVPGLARPIFDRSQQEEAFNRFRNSEAA